MRDNYIEQIKPLLENLKIDPYSFGYAGEMYLSYQLCKHEMDAYAKILTKYITPNKTYLTNRTPIYYSQDYTVTLQIILDTPADYKRIFESSIPTETKRYLLFILIKYTMSATAKLLDLCFIYAVMKHKLYQPLKRYVIDLSECLLNIAYDNQFPEIPEFAGENIKSLTTIAKNNQIDKVRQYVEMDHKMVLFMGYLLLFDYIKQYDLLISPLLGGAFIAPIFTSLAAKTNVMGFSKTPTIDYVKCSFYDMGQKDAPPPDEFLDEQLAYFQESYPPNCKVLLIDDNIGSGRTLTSLKTLLGRHFNSVDTCAIEFFWERKFNLDQRNLPSFEIDEIDLISPLSYRYFKNLDKPIERMNKKDDFMKEDIPNYPMFFPKSVEDLIHYQQFINQPTIQDEKRFMIEVMYHRVRRLKHLFHIKRAFTKVG